MLTSFATLTDMPRRREVAFIIDKKIRMLTLIFCTIFIVPHQDNRRPGSDCFAGVTLDINHHKSSPLKRSSINMHIDASPRELLRTASAPDSTIEMSSPIAGASSDISVMLYTAPWCRACKTVHRQFSKIAAKYPSVSFEQTSIDGNEDLESMGIAAVPHFKIIHEEKGVVESFNAGPTRSHIVEQKINKHIN